MLLEAFTFRDVQELLTELEAGQRSRGDVSTTLMPGADYCSGAEGGEFGHDDLAVLQF